MQIELCERRGMGLLESVSEDDNLYTLYLKSKRARGGVSTMVGMFIRNCLHLLRREVTPSNSEFRVAMEEAASVGAGCFFIDQNIDVTYLKLVDLFISSDSIWHSFQKVAEVYKQIKKEDYTRSSIQEVSSYWKDISPETFKVLVEDRDKHMFMELRRLQGKIVAVVGMNHMGGIELLWKRAENGEDSQRAENWQPPASQKCGLAMVISYSLNLNSMLHID
ncbi:hypothetical protein MKW92_004738 [Papaver armeniacum]|nr:hypothetical protein MKW92_004738 [Papaver armeniacum]